MFNRKKTKLFETTSVTATAEKNAFVAGAMKKTAITNTANGAKAYETSGNDFVDQFAKLSLYKAPRSYDEISKDCAVLYAQDPLMFVKFTIYMRIVNRKTLVFDEGEKCGTSQAGAGLKHESIMRMLWLYGKNENAFWQNLGLFVSAGSCKDIVDMMRYDLMYHGWDDKVLDFDKMANVVQAMLSNENSVNLMKKYLPQIKSNNKCREVRAQANNIIAKFLCRRLFGEKNGSTTYRQYRKLKTSGNAHEWQKHISRKNWEALDFNSVHGRALSLLVKSKFLKNQGLSDRYSEWIGEQKVAKYTGYIHELLCEFDFNSDKNFIETTNKQFYGQVQQALADDLNTNTGMIVVRDTSGSMASKAPGTKFSAYSIAKAMALYFSEFLSGPFANHWIEFNSSAKMHEWKGGTPYEKWRLDRSSYVGSTNFQSVIDLFVDLKRKGISEEHFPSGIICVSDGEFNPAQLGKTNVEAARRKLRDAGFDREYCDNFKIILWNIPNGYYGQPRVVFETFEDVKNVFYMSGYSAECVKFILDGKIETPVQLFEKAMSQELLDRVQV